LAPPDTRYARQVVLAEVGRRGQDRFMAGAARVIGCGRAAEECATYLAAAGVGRLVLEAPLREALEGRLAELNPDVRVVDGALDAIDVLPESATSRADGARAALDALVVLCGTASPGPWRWT
jgi:hypothetical protein